MPNIYSNGLYVKRIDYDTQDGSAVEQTRNSKSSNAASVSVSATVSSTTPTKTGYTFNGWNSKADGSGTNYAAGDSISHTFTRKATWDHTETIHGVEYNYFNVSNQSHTTTIYAKWTPNTYTVSYNANGGSGAPAAQTQNYPWHVQISTTTPTRSGHTFQGWATSSTGAATYQPGDWYTSLVSVTLYAVWSVVTYTVSYNKGSYGTGTNTTDTKTYNVALTLKGAIFTRTGYAQTGWATYDGGAQAYALSGSYTANASVTLYPAWTATRSTVSTTDGTLGTQQTITITRYSDSFTHTLTGQYGNYSWTIATGVGASYAWTPGVDLAAQFPAATRGLCTITCTTYSGSTNIGSSTTTCYLSIPSSICCTVGTVTLTEAVSGLASKFGAFIQGKSKATIRADINSGSGSPAYGATVSSYAITTNGQTLTSNGTTTGILNTAGTNNSYSFKITDTRGYSNTKADTYTVLAYSSPSVSAQISRNSSDSSKIDVKYSYSISACNNNNDKALSIKYRVVGGDYTTIPITISSYTGSNITYQITGLDANTAYEVVVTVTDYFTSASTTTNIQPTGNRVFDISDDDKTIARHGTNYSDGWDHQYFNEQFHGVLDVVPRRCSANLSQEGWYRVCKIADIGRGDYSFAIDLNICRQFDYANNEQHGIRLIVNWDSYSFVNETSKSNTQVITKVRYTRDGNGNGYIDIYYESSSGNNVYAEISVHGITPGLYSTESLQWVDPYPGDETEVTRYEFTPNGIRTVTLTAAHSSVTINNQKAVRSGKVVSLWVDFTVSTSISGYDYLINAPTFATAANALVYDVANTVQTTVRLYADDGNYGLRCYGSFPAGRYIAFITYITTDV